jgi:hypothetical protein
MANAHARKRSIADVRVRQKVVSGFSAVYANWLVAWDT